MALNVDIGNIFLPISNQLQPISKPAATFIAAQQMPVRSMTLRSSGGEVVSDLCQARS
jgi:hypothetical protein